MLMPNIFGESLFDDFMDDFAFPDIDKKLYGKHAPHIMKTDVKEKTTLTKWPLIFRDLRKMRFRSSLKTVM